MTISGVHALIYGKDADAIRAFFRDVLELPYFDAGDGWLIFRLPPAEIGAHPAQKEDWHGRHELSLLCDDVEATRAELEAKGVEFTKPVSDEGRGLVTWFKLPGGGELMMYEPRHASPLGS